MQSLGLDKTTNMLLQMVVMFSSDLAGLTESDTISSLQVGFGGRKPPGRSQEPSVAARWVSGNISSPYMGLREYQ